MERAAVELALAEAAADINALRQMLLSLWIDVRTSKVEPAERPERAAYREFDELYEYLRKRARQDMRRRTR